MVGLTNRTKKKQSCYRVHIDKICLEAFEKQTNEQITINYKHHKNRQNKQATNVETSNGSITFGGLNG